jgi:hypothetical protein
VVKIKTVINKYLEKIAAAIQDEKDAAKTFGRAWLTGHAGTLAGAALGGIALASPMGKKLTGSSGINKAKNFISAAKTRFSTSKIGQSAAVHAIKNTVKGTGTRSAVGGVVGGIVGGDIGDYAAIRHGILKSKQNAKDQK